MNDLSLSAQELQRIFDGQIRPSLFPEEASAQPPTLVLLGGQPGAGKSRATARLLAESPADMVPLSGDDLRPFHPHSVELMRSRSPEASRILADSAAGWLRSSLQHARTTGRSLLLDGTFNSPDVALATADLFAKHGFVTRVAVAATPRSESLLSAASRYLLDTRAGRTSRFTNVDVHDNGWQGTRALIATLEANPVVDRVTVLGHAGSPVFDAERTQSSEFAGASRALQREQSAWMSGTQTMRWLSELRAMSDYALTSQQRPRQLAELLIELHEIALNEVLPRMRLPTDSQARPAAEAALARQLVTLRKAVPGERRTQDLAAPVITSPQPDRGISR